MRSGKESDAPFKSKLLPGVGSCLATVFREGIATHCAGLVKARDRDAVRLVQLLALAGFESNTFILCVDATRSTPEVRLNASDARLRRRAFARTSGPYISLHLPHSFHHVIGPDIGAEFEL